MSNYTLRLTCSPNFSPADATLSDHRIYLNPLLDEQLRFLSQNRFISSLSYGIYFENTSLNHF